MEELINIIREKYFKDGIAQELLSDIKAFIADKVFTDYNEHRMNIETVIKNKVNQLPIALPNGRVGEDYRQRIFIDDPDITEYWVECYKELGLDVALEEVAIQQQEPTSDKVDSTNPSEQQSDSETTQSEGIVTGTSERGIILSGIPTQAGDFDIIIKFKYKQWIQGSPIIERKFKLAINPDPRSLWKNIPTSKDIPFYKEDTAVDYIKVEEVGESGPRKDIVAASKRGRSHAQEGKARDDHFKLYHCDESDWYIIAVADGAGSAKFSRRGSQIACDTVVDYCKEKLMNCADFEDKIRSYKNAEDEESARKSMANVIYGIVANAAFKAHKNINEAAEASKDINAVPKDFATTLMFAICKKFEFGWFVASFWVGDGAMCLYNKEKQTFKLLGVPDEGEYSGQTRFLTMPEIFRDPKEIMERLRFSIEEDFTALILMTDGVSDPMFETENNLNSIKKWNELWDALKNGFPKDKIGGVELTDDNEESKKQLLGWLDFWSAGNHDDRTIAILY